MYELAASGYLAANDAEAFVEQALEQLAKAYRDIGPARIGTEPNDRLSTVETRLRNFHANGKPFPLTGISPSEVDTYQKVFAAVARRVSSPRSAREIIEAVIAQSSKHT